MGRDFLDDISVNTIVGPGSFIDGPMSSGGFLKVDGDINGDVISKSRVVVSDSARINGSIKARSVVIGGIVKGDIIASEGVLLSDGAVVLGAIITRNLVVEDNVLLTGFCYAINDQSGYDEAEKLYRNKQALKKSTISRLH